MVLHAGAQVLSKGYEARGREIVRNVPPRNMQKRVADLLLSSLLREESQEG
jgi:hypothetical protein